MPFKVTRPDVDYDKKFSNWFDNSTKSPTLSPTSNGGSK